MRFFSLKRKVGNFIFGNRCMGCFCHLPTDQTVCKECEEEFVKAKLKRPKVVTYRKRRYLITGVYEYKSIAGEAVRNLKFNRHTDRADGLGKVLSDKLKRKRISHVDVITYVPMTLRKESNRRVNHAELLALHMAEHAHLPCKKLLRKRYETEEQHALTGRERKQNMYDAFVVCRPVKDQVIVLVDDVCTTGSTICECAKTLYDAGAKQVVLLTVTLV